jgi:hypothetical protein
MVSKSASANATAMITSIKMPWRVVNPDFMAAV